MSRSIGCEINGHYQIVWQYRFACPSDMHRISTQLNIGEYHQISGLEDSLILVRSDVEKLEEQIQTLKAATAVNEDKWLIAMIEAFRDCIVANPEQDKFIFEGDL
jgi:hypothetical protein